MMKLGVWSVVLWLLSGATEVIGLEPTDFCFLISAQVSASPARINLAWAPNPSKQITVKRKLPADTEWTSTVATLPAGSTQFTDAGVEIGKVYEYQISGTISESPLNVAYGYIAAGIEIPRVESRGKVVLVVDRTHADALASELETLRANLIGDGWQVVRRDVWPTDSVTYVKEQIRYEYTADPNNLRSVFLIGHVPVPYSGVLNPDMHDNHVGAWPADVYYGEMDGEWSDDDAYKTGSQFPSNDNIPGDGKFDESVIPGQVELEVGRVDMANLDVFSPRTEQELLRNYLVKNHRYRHGQITAPARGLIRDSFDIIDGDVPAADAWRAFPALFGAGNYATAGANQFFPTLNWEGYLWAYGGGGGDFTKADGIGWSSDFAASDPRAIFYLLHGSYFGDWNTRNNFLRSAIATPTYGLVAIWSSLPHWYFQQVALGAPIGYAVRLVANNRGLYKSQADFSFAEVHISMMGDPTLRSYVLPPPRNPRLTVEQNNVVLRWDSSGVNSYNVYRAASLDGPYVRVNNSPVASTQFVEARPSANCVYMIKSAALQTTGSGSFHNESQGVFVAFSAGPIQLPTVNVTAIDSIGDEAGDSMVFEFSRTGPTTGPLAVAINVSGSAAEGEDFILTDRTVEFSNGEAVAKLTIIPNADAVNELEETMVVSIASSASYSLGTNVSASATIRANGESKFAIPTLGPSGALTIAASGFAARNYRIESRAPEGQWRTRKNGVSGADGNVSFTETVPGGEGCELYRIVWE
jgi:hypothetical protein